VWPILTDAPDLLTTPQMNLAVALLP
jgi:hypothetical protein